MKYVLFLYECIKNDHPALAIMDGPFVTLYLTRRKILLYTLYSRVKSFNNFQQCSTYKKNI